MADTPTSAKKEPELPPIVQTAWMNPTARAWLAAARPWSAPASLIPISLAGAVLWRTEGSNLLTVDFALTLVGGLLVHLAANLANTYYDFKNVCCAGCRTLCTPVAHFARLPRPLGTATAVPKAHLATWSWKNSLSLGHAHAAFVF